MRNSDRLIFHDHRIELTSKTLGTLTVHGNTVAKDLNPVTLRVSSVRRNVLSGFAF